MMDWVRDHASLLWWLSAGSAVAFFATLLLIPWMVLRIPPDYFLPRAMPPTRCWHDRIPAIRLLMMAVKNLVGGIFILAGLVMLVTPGQGLLTILAGFLLLNFPGKRQCECWLISRGPALRLLNRFRIRHGRAPLILPPRMHKDPQHETKTQTR